MTRVDKLLMMFNEKVLLLGKVKGCENVVTGVVLIYPSMAFLGLYFEGRKMREILMLKTWESFILIKDIKYCCAASLLGGVNEDFIYFY